MENEVVKYLSKHLSLSDELIEIIIESTTIKCFNKGTILLNEGELANESYFIFKGCIRSYLLKNGEEKTLEFYTEEQSVASLSYGTKKLSQHYLECVEDTVVCLNTLEHESEMFRKYPQFESICRTMTELMLTQSQESFTNYKLSTPEDRYLSLLKYRPDLIQRVPQYQLASYLGIKPESLSRIRKRIQRNQKNDI